MSDFGIIQVLWDVEEFFLVLVSLKWTYPLLLSHLSVYILFLKWSTNIDKETCFSGNLGHEKKNNILYPEILFIFLLVHKCPATVLERYSVGLF